MTGVTELALKVGVVIPCLDEEEAIGGVVREVRATGFQTVIVVDNGSTDETAENARAAGALVVVEPQRGYGRACATGIAALPPEIEIVCFMDGDGSDPGEGLAAVTQPILDGTADFVLGSRVRGTREKGSLTPQQVVAGRMSGVLIRSLYGARFSDMSPVRAIRVDVLRALAMRETTYGWNLEMQMRAAAADLRCVEIPVGHRLRRGGQSKVSGNVKAVAGATWKIATTFLRLARDLRKPSASRQQLASTNRP